MALPPSPPSSAQQALAKAAEARKKRAELKGELKSGKSHAEGRAGAVGATTPSAR